MLNGSAVPHMASCTRVHPRQQVCACEVWALLLQLRHIKPWVSFISLPHHQHTACELQIAYVQGSERLTTNSTLTVACV